MRKILALPALLLAAEPAHAGILDLDALSDRIGDFVSGLIGEKADPEVIAAPRDLDREMLIQPPRTTAPIRNILPGAGGTLRRT